MGNILTTIQRLAERLLASRELPEDSHAWSEVKKILGHAAHYSQGYQLRGGGRDTQ
jgi:hypothetical protein